MKDKNFTGHLIKDQRGVSLVEMIIVIAIIGIMAGSSYALFNNVKSANLQSTVETVDSSIHRLQMQTLSKTGNPYLYIYKLGDGYYLKIIDGKYTAFDGSVMDTDGKKVAGNDVHIYLNTPSSDKMVGNSGKIIRIAYKKSGEFSYTDSDTNVTTVVISGISTKSIRLMRDTGKHIAE